MEFLNYAGAIASNLADAKFPEIQTKKMMFFARDLNGQDSISFKTIPFQLFDTKCALAQWLRQRERDVLPGGHRFEPGKDHIFLQV
jgi:hypothetical protein